MLLSQRSLSACELTCLNVNIMDFFDQITFFLWNYFTNKLLSISPLCYNSTNLHFCVVFEEPADLQAVCTGRRRTCALLNSPLPCVNKAVNHIQELKMIVEDWCQQVNWTDVWECVKDRAATTRWKYKSTENVFLFCHASVWKVSAAGGSGQAPVQQNFKVKPGLLWFYILFVLSLTLIYHRSTDFSPETRTLSQWCRQSCLLKASPLIREVRIRHLLK